uniref:Uncharacterized protein n=2 Tax=viral metagenome TaxID=1070528 RepID=A0A6M3X831_9ZZZZ
MLLQLYNAVSMPRFDISHKKINTSKNIQLQHASQKFTFVIINQIGTKSSDKCEYHKQKQYVT